VGTTPFCNTEPPLQGRCTLSEANRCGDDLTLIASRDRFDITSIAARSLDRLEADRFRGYDPYDALSSPLFRLPVLRSSRWLRIAAEQALKRSRVDFRPLRRIPRGYNPVTLAFVLEACAYRARADLQRADAFRARAAECVAELARLRTGGYSDDCWGCPFDWEARYGRLPAGTPTIVATGIVTNSLFTAYRLLQLNHAFEMCKSAARFVLDDLPRAATEDSTFCWGCFLRDTQRVLNATMKGGRLCAQVYSVTGDEAYLEPATQTAAYAARRQGDDGSWPYAVGDARHWGDNFHTAYVIDAFDSYECCASDRRFHDVKARGWRYYRKSFFFDDRIPKYYPDKPFPVDATACAQSLLTLCRFGDIGTAVDVAEWTVQKMHCPDGHFAYQVRRRRVVRIPYMRWASAYMHMALSRLAYALTNEAAAA
jgi:hypothetical protein